MHNEYEWEHGYTSPTAIVFDEMGVKATEFSRSS